MFTNNYKIKFIAIYFLFSATLLFASRTGISGLPQEVCIDFPESFAVEECTPDLKSFLISSPVIPVKTIVKLSPKEKFEDNAQVVKENLTKLQLQNFETAQTQWRNQELCVASFDGSIMAQDSTGWALSIFIPKAQEYLFVCSWCSKQEADLYSCFIFSILNSIYIDSESYFIPGPMAEFAFPGENKKKNIELQIAGEKISTFIDNSDVEAADFLIESEYNLLCFYAQSPAWLQAWQRYYRMIFRDSCGRLQNVSFDVYNALSKKCSDDTEYAQKLLSWTQNFNYNRQTNKADFTSLPAAITGSGCDCDSRSMLLAVMLQSVNIECILFVSAEYSHAIAGLVSEHPGFAFSVGEKEYLTGETTKKGCTWGQLSIDQSDQSKWIPVLVP